MLRPIFVAILSVLLAGQAFAADKVTLMLNWYVYGEHAPFYYGKEKEFTLRRASISKSRLLPIMYDSVHMAWSVLRLAMGTSLSIENQMSGSEPRGAIESTHPSRDGARQPQQ
jgi:hypothetical protein